MARPQHRVFEDAIGPWPEIYALNPGYLARASHLSPRGLKSFITVATVLTLILTPSSFAWFMLSGEKFWMSAFNSFGIFLISTFGFHYYLKPRFRTNLAITFLNGEIRWQGRKKQPHLVPASLGRVFIAEEHRGGVEEDLMERRVARRNQGQPHKPQELARTYRDAFEVIVRFGPSGMRRLVIAEIAEDRHGEVADKLRSALEFVDSQAQAESQPQPQEFINAARGATVRAMPENLD